MRTLTIRQPWAGLVALGVKDVENRSWRPPDELVGERFAVHAGRWDDEPRRMKRLEGLATSILEHDALDMTGFIVCTVRLVDVMDDHGSPWAVPGQWHWVLDRPKRVRNSPFLRGRPGLWTS